MKISRSATDLEMFPLCPYARQFRWMLEPVNPDHHLKIFALLVLLSLKFPHRSDDTNTGVFRRLSFDEYGVSDLKCLSLDS